MGISLRSGLIGEPGTGVSIYWNFEIYLKEVSGNGAPLSMGSVRGTCRGPPLLRSLKDI